MVSSQLRRSPFYFSIIVDQSTRGNVASLMIGESLPEMGIPENTRPAPFFRGLEVNFTPPSFG